MAIDKSNKEIKTNYRYSQLLSILCTINYKSDRLDLTELINSFKMYKSFTPKQTLWIYKMGRKWFYSEDDLRMKSFVEIASFREDILNLSDQDFELLENHLTEEERIITYRWKCEDYKL